MPTSIATTTDGGMDDILVLLSTTDGGIDDTLVLLSTAG